MGSSSTSSVYIQVIEDVINKVREEFISNGGPGEGVLNQLQGIWESKMMQAGAIVGPIERSSAAKLTTSGAPAVHDLNVPYQGPEEYETPTADLLFPPTPLQTPMQATLPAQTPLPGTVPTPLPGTLDNSYNIPVVGAPIVPNDHPPASENETSGSKSGRPSLYMQPLSTWLNQSARLDVNVAFEEGHVEAGRGAACLPMTQDLLRLTTGKRKRDDLPSQYYPGEYIPQEDGAGDVIVDKYEVGQGSNSQPDIVIADNRKLVSSPRILQLDGTVPDPYDDALSTPNIYYHQGAANEDYNVANTPAPPEPQAPVNPNDVLGDDEDEPLNENDDDDDLDVGDDDELNTKHLVLAQFDKVTRAKNRWKCSLKDGIMHINNQDKLFHKALGEFNF